MGPVRQVSTECANRTLVCLACGCTGELSINLTLMRPRRR